MRLAAVLIAMLLGGPALAQTDPWAGAARSPGRIAAIATALNEEAWFMPGGPGADGRPALLKARVLRPPGSGPFKVAIINHGSPPSASGRPVMPVPSYRAASEWFVARGYMVVLPLRRGYGESGAWPETYGPCRDPNFVAAGTATADDIEAIVRYLRTLPPVRRDRVLLVGQSAGGFGVVAASARNPEGVFAAINFAGGRGGHQGGQANENCVPDRLVQAAGSFGRGAKVPMLWLYTQNDTFFAPSLSRRMHEAYHAAGGNAAYVLLPAFKKDGHEMFGQADGLALWTDPVAAFLARLE
jgi:dienelactone hydrolase